MKGNRLCHPKWNSSLVNIALTRAIGDVYFKEPQFTDNLQSGLIAEPDIIEVVLTKDDAFVFLASDGYWDVITPQETVKLIEDNERGLTPTEMCQFLTETALKRASSDNVTALLINLHQ